MKKAIYIILLAFIAVFTFASCEREYAMSEVGTESIAPVLQGVSDQSIDANNAKVESVIFNWSPASFGAPVQIQYTLYLTRPDQADYLIGQTFSTSVAVEKASINSGAVALGIPKNGTGTVGAKVVAEVYTGPTPSSSFAMKNTSNSISFDVTTFEAAKDWIFLPGVYNGWGDSNEKEEWKVWETDGGNKKYRTLVQLKEADWDAGKGFCPFKIFANGAWLGYNDGYEPAWGRIFVNDDGNWATPASEPINFIEVNMTTNGDEFLVRLNANWDGENKYGTATSPSSSVEGGFELENGATAANIKSPGAGNYIVRLYANRTPLVITYIAQ